MKLLLQMGSIALKDLREVFRSPAMIAVLLFSPLFYMLLLGFVFPNAATLRDVPFAIVDEDAPALGDPLGAAFLDRVYAENDVAGGAFTFYEYPDLEAAKAAIRAREVLGALRVPPTFSEDVRRGGRPVDLEILYDPTNPAMSRLVAAAAQSLVSAVAAGEGVGNVRETARLGSEEAARALVTPYRATTTPLTGVEPSYFQFLAPGLLMLVLVSAVLTGLPSGISKERENGTLDGLLVAPVPRVAILLGKGLALLARGFFQAASVLVLAYVLFGVAASGRYETLALVLALGVFSFIGLGVLLTTFAKDQAGAGGLVMAVYFPMLFLSGVLFPVEQMPAFLQAVSRGIPLTYAVDAARKVMLLDAGVPEILPEITILAAFGVATLALAVPVFARAVRS